MFETLMKGLKGSSNPPECMSCVQNWTRVKNAGVSKAKLCLVYLVLTLLKRKQDFASECQQLHLVSCDSILR